MAQKYIEQINNSWRIFFNSNRTRWINEYHPTFLHFLKELKFTSFEYELEQNGYIDNSYYVKFIHLGIESEMIYLNGESENETIQTKISTLDSDTSGGESDWVVNGEFELIDSYEGYGKMYGNEILEEYCDIVGKESELQKILRKFNLTEKVEKMVNESIVQKDEEMKNKVKEKFGSMVKEIRKTKDYWIIEFINGITMKGDMQVIIDK